MSSVELVVELCFENVMKEFFCQNAVTAMGVASQEGGASGGRKGVFQPVGWPHLGTLSGTLSPT